MNKILLILFFFLFNTKSSYTNEIENIPIIKKLDKKYLNLIDKNGEITDLKEFNKNGKVIVFENDKVDKNNYLIIFKKNEKIYTCYQTIKVFLKNRTNKDCLKKDGSVNIDIKNFKMHYIVPLNYGDYFKKLLNIADNRKLTKEEIKKANNIHNSLPKELRTQNLNSFIYEKYRLTPEEIKQQQEIHLIIKDGIVVYYHHYDADLNKLFK